MRFGAEYLWDLSHHLKHLVKAHLLGARLSRVCAAVGAGKIAGIGELKLDGW